MLTTPFLRRDLKSWFFLTFYVEATIHDNKRAGQLFSVIRPILTLQLTSYKKKFIW